VVEAIDVAKAIDVFKEIFLYRFLQAHVI